ncbi:putative Ig domain-containing protein [Microcoleus sp. B4-C1]|uniref:putative Ig domain-containing protein n=1 Tax=Microcoleus sp. B4-C1 TaxID=2818660 RepID=UPI002FD041F0
MPLTDPIGEPLIEKQESLIPGLAPTKPPLLPGIQTSKPLLYQAPAESSESEQLNLNLIEPASEPTSEFSLTETDAFIINKPSDINSISSANTSLLITNSTLRDTTNSEVDPLIGKLDSDLGDLLINPNRIASNNVSSDSNKSATDIPPVNSSISSSELNKTTAATTAVPDELLENKTQLSPTASTKSEQDSDKTLPVVTASTTSEKASDKTPLPATAETTSKLEEHQTPLSSETTLKSESSPNKISPATASTSDNSGENTTSPATASATENPELDRTLPATTSTTDKSEPDRTSPATVSTTDKSELDQTSPATASAAENPELDRTLPATTSTTDKSEPDQTSPATVLTTDKSESNKTSVATVSTTDKSESNKTSPTEISTTNNLETATNLEPNKTSTPEPDQTSTPPTNVNFDSNAFTVDEKGIVGIQFTSDGGWYSGQLAIVSLLGMEKFVPGSEAFIKEAASRALSNSTKGYIAISDDLEGAYYTDPNSSENLNSGQYLGTKTFAMTPGDKFFFMLVPNGTVQQVYDNPAIGDDKKPLFSIATDNPSDTFSIGQIADITGEGQLFAMEDMGLIQGSDIDYDDITFRVTGATSKIVPLSELVDSFSASIHSQLVQKLKGESDKSEPKFTRESTVTNSGDQSQGETPSITADNDQQKPQPTAATVANSDSQESQPTATSTVDKSDTEEAQPTETSTVGKSDTEEAQPTKTSTVGKSDSQESPATETSTVGKSDSQESQQIETSIVDKSDTQESPATETSTVGKSDSQESQQIEQTASPPETPSVSPTELNSEIELPVLAEFIVSESADTESIKTDTTATNRIPQLPASADYAVNNAASPPTAETLLIPTPIASQPPAKTSEIADNFGEELPRQTNDNLPNAASQLPTQITEVIPASKVVDTQENDRAVTETAAKFETEQFLTTTAEIIATETEKVADLIEYDTTFPEITSEFESQQLVTKTESIVATPEADDTVERELPVAEKTAEFESQQLPPKTDDFAIAEFTADTIDTDIAVTFTAAELETENSPAIVVNSLDTDPLISHSNSSVQTDSPIPALFSTPSETAAGTAQIASVETSVSPSTLKFPPESNSNTYNSNSTPTETTESQPAYSDTEIAPKPADISSGLLPLEAEESEQFSDGTADSQSYSAQSAGNFQSNINAPRNLSITTTANLQIPGTFIVDNRGEVRFDYVFDGGSFEGELGIFSLAGMSGLTPGTPEFIAEASRRVLSNSTDGHIVISDATEGAKFTGAMPFDWEWGSGEYQGIKTFNMTPGDTFAVMLVPNGTVQSSLESSYSGNWFPENRPLFSIATANPNDTSYVLPLADTTGTGNTFAMEDMSAANSDGDYNDLIFTVLGATGNAPLLDAVINPDREWRNTQLGQQLIEYANSQVPPETAPPAIAAALVNDTGSNSTDGITNNPAISGTITDASDIASFRASFSRESTGIELKDLLTSDGSFALTPNTLSTVNGNTLTDGTYTLYLLATDSHGNTNTFELPFTLDTTPPELTFGLNPAFDTPPVADGQTLDSTVTLTGQTDPGSTVILAETGAVTTADSTGRFEFAGVTLAIGSNSFTATATDNAGNSSTASRTFTRTSATDSGVIWLAEGTSFTEKLERPITIPAVPSTLTVNIAGLNFDLADSDSIKDAFEIALVDASGRSLVHTVGTGLNSFFNFTEGQPPQLAAGVTFNGSNISVNLSQIADGTAATLQIRLVNNDSDTATQVGITSIAIQPSSAAIVPVTASPSEDVSPNVPVNFNRLQDVSSSLEVEYKQTSFNSSSKILYADLAVKNAGQYPVRGTLLVGINNISDPTVRLLDADGMTPEGIPYYDISKLVGDGILKPGELTSTDTLKFYNPQGVQFSYDLVFLSQLNQVPQFKATPNTEALVGKSYVYTAIAVDADGDALTYSLLEKPLGMEIDAQTGIISWNPVAGDIGNHAVTVEVGDGKGGVAKQKYVLSAINPPPNRPPIFTSTPIVDAAVNTPYRYDADAKDPDSDTLTYNLVLGPEGMRVNPETGIVQWTPPAAMVFGDTVLGRIGNQGEQDIYTFSALEGQRLYYDSLRSTPGQTLKLYSPSGLLVLDSNTSYQGSPINLTETGNYRLVIDGAAGDYGFSLIDMEQTPVAPFDRNVTGVLSPGSEDDAYRFNGAKGQRLYFDQLSTNSNLNWVLYDGEGRQVSSWVDGKQVSSWYVGWYDNEIVLPSDSEYTLVMRGSAPFFGSTSYTFRIVTPDTITYPLQLGNNANPNTVSAAITEKGEQDIYTFGGTKGQRLYFDYLSSSSQVNASVKLVSPSGVDTFNINLGADTEPFTINETGTYRLEIDGHGESTGNYSFNLLDVGQATPINLDADVTGNLNPGFETHFYSFTGDASQRLYLDSEPSSGWANWTLYGPGNQAIATDSKTTFGGPNTYAGYNPSGLGGDFEVVLPSAGSYLLAVQGRNATPFDYKFRVITPQTQSGGTLTPDTWGNLSVSGSISEKGERDVYTFSGSTNQRLLLDALVETPNTYVRLVSPSGIEVFNTPASGDWARTIPYILPEAGNYRLIVDGYIESTENYNFRLLSLTTAPTLNLNAPTSGTLSPGSETDVYQFTGTEGDRLYLDTLLSSSPGGWNLYGPGNQLVTSNYLWSDIETVLPGSGTYYIVLRGDGTPAPGGNGTAAPINYSIQPFFSTANPTPLTLGSVNSASISKPGEQDVYTFTGSVGQRLYFDPQLGNGNITAKITSPSGLEIFSGYTSADGLSNILTESGTYRLTIDGNYDTSGNYSFRLGDATAAPTLSPGTATPGSLPPNEAVLYQISGTAGERIQFDSLSPTASGASWALYAPGFPNFSSQIGGSGLNSDFEVLLPVTGTYTLALQNPSSSSVSYNISANNITPPPVANSGLGIARSGTVSPGTPANQTFTASAGTLVYFDSLDTDGDAVSVTLLNPSGSVVSALNGSSASTDSPSPIQLQQTGTYTLRVEGTGDYGYSLLDLGASQTLNLNTTASIPSIPAWGTTAYKFDGAVGQKLYYDGLTNNSGVSLKLISASGRQIANFTAAEYWTNIAADRLDTLTESGTHYLLVSNDQATPTANVSFRLLDRTIATPLVLDTDIQSTFTPSPSETDLYRFDGQAGQYLYFDALDGSWSNTWTLYGPGGQTVINRTQALSDFELALPGDGEYLLALQGHNGNPATYKFQVVTPTMPVASLPIGTPTPPNSTISEPGEQDIYTFNGTAGQRLYFDGIADSGSKNVRLLSPSGVEVFPNISTSWNRDLFALLETGIYRAVVDTPTTTYIPDTTKTGAYSFRFLDASTAATVVLDAPAQTWTVGANETRLLQFAGTAGQNVYFLNDGSNWTLYGPGNSILKTNWSGDAELTLPSDGTYTVALVNPYNSSANYPFQAVTSERTTAPIEFGNAATGAIGKMGELDTYTFTGTVGQQLVVDSLVANDPYLRTKIFSPSGKKIYEQQTTAEQTPITLQEAGAYRVEIDGDWRGTGNYSFRLLDTASTNHPSVFDLPFDQNLSGTLASARERQVYRFEGTEGQHLYFDLAGSWDYWNKGTGWTLYGPDNQVIPAPLSGLSPDLEVRLPGNGTYTLVMGGSTNVTTQESYQFKVVTPETTVSPLTLSSPVTSSINEPGERDIYKFNGKPGQRLLFDRIAGDSNFTVKLFSPSIPTDTVLNDPNSGSINEYWWRSIVPAWDGRLDADMTAPMFLREAGEYHLVIDGTNNTTGNYSFRLVDVEDPQAVPLLNLDADISNTLAPGTKIDFYQFKPAVGQPLYFDLAASTGSGVSWVLYGPDNKPIPTAGWTGSDFEITPTIPGTYVLALQNNSATSANYSFKVVTPSITTPTALELGRAVSGTIGEAGERDEYTFAGTPGQRVYFDSQGASNSNIRVKLVSPGGAEFSNNTWNPANSNANWNAANTDWPPATLTESGTYRLVVDGDNNATGNYNFRLSDIARAASLIVGTPTLGTLDPGNEVELYKFRGTAGQRLNFDVAVPFGSSADWILYGPNNLPLSPSSGTGEDFNLMLPTSGEYVLGVRGRSSTPVNYSFTVTNSTPASVATAGLGSLQSGNIAAGQVVNHTFTANAGTRIYFDSQDLDNDPVDVRLFNPQGSQIFHINASNDWGHYQLQQTGTYTVRVQGSSPTSTGDYRYRILELPSVTPDPRDNENSIQMGVTVSKTQDPGRTAEVYSFTGKAGQTIFYDGMIPSGGAESVNARLVSPSGDTIFLNDGWWRPSSTGDAGPYTLSESGTYNLLLTGEQDSPADYRFRVLDFADAQDLELNKRVSATLAPGNPVHLYKFTGTAGQRVFFDSISGSGANWVLYQPGHQGNQPRIVGNQNNIGTDFEALLPVDGQYVLAVIGHSTTASAYSFQTLSGKSVPAIVTPGDGETSGAIGEELGTYRVVLETNDGKGGVAQQDFQVRVVPEPGNSSPTFNTPAVTSGYTSGRYVYDTDASDTDGDTLTYLLEDAPSGAIIDSETGRIIWATPVEGTHKVRVRVEDGRGNADIQSFDLSISSVVPGTVKGSVYLDADGTGTRRVTNPGNMTPDSRVVVDPRFADNYAAYNLNRPDGVPGILGAMTFKRNPDGTVDPNTLLLGGGAASPGGALYEVKVVRGENGHIIGLDDDGDPETPYTANYFADSSYSDAGLVYTPDNVLLSNLWKPGGIHSIKPGGAPNQRYPGGLGGLTFVPEGFPGEGQLKATGAYPSSGFYTVTYTRNGNFPDGTPRYIINPPELETTAGAGPGAFVYMPISAPNFDSGEGLLMAEWNGGGIYAYSIDNDGNPIPSSRTPFVTNYGGAWGATTDPVTGDLLFNAWAGFSNLMVVRGLGKPTDNEPGMENWLVYVDTNRDGIRNTNEPFTYSDVSGNYSFTLAPGNYRIVSQLQPGWTQTSPTNPIYQEVTVTANNTKFGVDFAATNSKLAGPNIDPEFTSTPPTTVKAGERLVYRTTATDLNNDDLTFDLAVAPKGMAVAPNGTISWRPPLSAVGTHDIIVRVNDGRGGIDLQAFKIEVTPGNNAPVFTSQLPQNINPAVNQPFQYQAKAIDLDGDTITYSIIPNSSKPVTPTNATINPTTGVINWTPTTAQQGGAFNWAYAGEVEPWEILIKATDNKGGEAFQRIELTVSPAAPNRAPSITSTPRTNTRLGKTYFYQVEAKDPDGNPLTYTLLNPPSGMAFATPASTPAGMTFQEGLISWTPGVSQQGTYPITVRVSDGLGGLATQTFNLIADNIANNRAPSIDSTPTEQITNLAKLYQYNLTGSDADGDRLLWSLDKAPSGMIVDPLSGSLRWQPNAEQIGENTISVRTIDGNGGYAVQEFSLTVRGINTPPTVVSTPPSKAAVNQVYAYTVVATDLENDPLTFSLSKYPVGMAIDSNGVIQWMPNATQIGLHSVEVAVTDKQGAIATQTFTVTAGTTATNLPPAITSTPVFTASPGRPYSYQVTATDADGTISQYQLLQSPTGMTINSATGVVTWNNPVAGNHQVVVGAVDNSGTGAAQGFELISRANSAAVVPNVPIQSVSPGASYRYDLKATDSNGDLLTFGLIQSPTGMTVDEFGRISWKPTAANIGNHPVSVKVTDTFGESVTVSYNLSVVADTSAPKVNLIASNNTANLGDSVIFTVNAVDNVKVESLGLTINGTPVVLDAQGRATVKLNNLTPITAIATALDAAGNVGNATQVVRAIDTDDVNAPIINISLADDVDVSTPLVIRGTITDSNLDYYTLSVAPVGSSQFKEVYRGTTAVSNETIATFDPTVLANGAYTLKFTAFDANGNGSTTERTVNVAGDLKLGNFRLSFTDLSVPVAGIPINVTRTYDSLNANSSDDFGYGWRMEFRDTDLKTSLKADPTYEELGINTVPFDSKTKVFITLPGGKRETFTFKPNSHYLNQYLGAAGPGAAMYKPAFESHSGSTVTLTVKDANLIRNEYGEYYGVNGQPFNPENPAFGGVYVLTTLEGLVYEIDAKSGDLLTATDANGNKLSFSDAGIASSTGKSVTFERDVAGRIVGVVDPDGKKVKYEYDAKGDLVAVKDRENNATRFEYEDEDRPHFLTEVIDSLGRSGVKTEYDDSGRLKQVINGADVPINIEYKPEESVQVVKDVYGNPTIYKYDTRGNVLQVADAYGNSTYFEYDDNNNVTQTKDANNLVTKYQYDSQSNLISRTETYCGCPGVVPGTSHYTYNGYGQMTSLVTPTGALVRFNYDSRGNLLSIKDGQGNVIQSFTYYANGLVKTETEGASTTYYEYDDYGNAIKSVESDGSATYMTYDSNGRLKTMVQDSGTPADTTDDETYTFTYDKLGREKRVDYGDGIWVEYGYTGSGSDWTSLDAPTIGHMERKLTDDGKLAGWVTPDGGTPSFYYDLAGRLWKETDEAGNITTEYEYDAAGRLTSIKDVQTGAEITKKYDAGGRRIEEIDPLGAFVKTVYDPRSGKLTSTQRGKYLTDTTNNLILDAAGNPIPDPAVNPQTWTYEYSGTRTTITDPLGRKTTSVQDANYLPVETIYQQRDGLNYSEKVKYLYANNLQEAKDYPTEITDIGGNDRDFTYDQFGRLKTATDLGNNIYTYTYGEDGLALIESPDSVTSSGTIKEKLRYEYDDLGNLKKVIYGDGTFKQMTYRSTDNRLGTATLPSGETITYEYNSAGMVESETTKTAAGLVTSIVTYTYGNGGNIKTVKSGNDITTYHYDSLTGALSGINYPDGSGIAYTYDLLGRVKGQTEWASASGARYVTSYGYDAFGNLATVTDPVSGVTQMVYDDANRLKQRILPDGKVTTTYEYDGLDRVKSIVHKNDRGEVLASVSYERIGIGEPTKITREDSSYVLLEYDESLRVKKESYYDASGVLQDETTYTYDAAGKRLVESNTNRGSRSFNYQPGYQLDTVAEVGETENYDYDSNGRLTLIERDGKTLDLQHDTYDRLTEVDNKTTGETTQYIYDGQGNRVKAVEGNQERRFLVTPAGGSGLESTDLMTDANGNLISNYIYGGSSSPFMRLDASGNPVYYLTDAMGTVIGLADGNGQEVGDFRYDSFGNLRNASGVAANAGVTSGDFRFQGQWLESESGLYYMRARDYDPKTGLFLSRDPVEPTEQQIEAFNPYQFAYNNPYIYSDPSGMISIMEIQAAYTVEKILYSIENRTKQEIYERFKDKAVEVAGDVFWSVLKTFAPINSPLTDGVRAMNNALDAGVEFERKFKGQVRDMFADAGINLDQVFLEVGVTQDGQATGNWINFPNIEAKVRAGERRPDYVLTPPGNQPRGRGVQVTGGPQRSYLIGDIKLQLKTIVNTYIGSGGKAPENAGQWDAIANYARKNGSRVAGFVTLFGDYEKGRQQSFEQIAQKAALRKGFTVFIVSILHGVGYSKR